MVLLHRSWPLLALLQTLSGTWATITPRVVEVDLIFPRNDTSYSPSPVFPIVFAIQNSRLLMNDFSPRIYWNVEQVNTGVDLDKRWTRSSSIEVSKRNYTSSDPFYICQRLSYFNVEGLFRFAFEFSMTNCSENPEMGKMVFQRPHQRSLFLSKTTPRHRTLLRQLKMALATNRQLWDSTSRIV
jgi:hypothetical protein